MSKPMRRGAAFAAVLALAAPAFAPAALAQDGGATGATVIATVNGTEITLAQVIALRESLPSELLLLEDDMLFNAIVEQLIQQQVLAQTRETLSPRDEANLAITRMDYLSGVAMEAIIAEGVNEAAIEATYEELMAGVPPVTEYSAAHILVETEAEAIEIKQSIDEGADFGEVARGASLDPGSAAAGGEMGFFDPARMVKPFQDAVIAAEKGVVTDPVQSEYGWHVILVHEQREIRRPTLDEARAEVASEVERRLIAAEIERLSAEAEITRPGADLDPALMKNTALID
ncbi:peptidylprolyl isomerase [Pseudogemmobacter sonorensis]|uniref:peptidylprolyl isomerase n=1 Tax=Pseudogemmobacter sonorensis TaxID=2989681 RepID=UPI0036914657